MKTIPWYEHCLWLRSSWVRFITFGRSAKVANQLSAAVGALGELVELKQEKMALEADYERENPAIPTIEWEIRMKTYEYRKLPAWMKASEALTACGIPKSRK